MKSEMRFKVLVAVAAPADERAGRVRRFRRSAADARRAGELCRHRRHSGALGGDVHRARQGADPSALPELPSGRRPPAPGRREPAAPAAGLARRRRIRPGRHALPDLPPAGQFRSRPRARAIRLAPRAARDGVGRQDARPRSARRSRIPRATAAGARGSLVEHIGDDHLVGWAWAPGFGRQPAPGTQKQAGALVEAWVKTGAACPN